MRKVYSLLKNLRIGCDLDSEEKDFMGKITPIVPDVSPVSLSFSPIYEVHYWNRIEELDNSSDTVAYSEDKENFPISFRVERYLLYSARDCIEAIYWARRHAQGRDYEIFLKCSMGLAYPVHNWLIYGSPPQCYHAVIGIEESFQARISEDFEELLQEEKI